MSDSQSSSRGTPEQSSGFQLFEMAYGKHDAFFLFGRFYPNLLAEINQNSCRRPDRIIVSGRLLAGR